MIDVGLPGFALHTLAYYMYGLSQSVHAATLWRSSGRKRNWTKQLRKAAADPGAVGLNYTWCLHGLHVLTGLGTAGAAAVFLLLSFLLVVSR